MGACAPVSGFFPANLFISGACTVQRRQFVSIAAAMAAPAFIRNARADEGGITGKTVSIGCSAALSGPLAGFGTDLRQGADAAIAQINARGGVHGRALQLNMVDDAYVPQRTTENVKQMLSQGSAFALLSCVGTPNNTAILPLVEEAGIPYVAPLTGASWWSTARTWKPSARQCALLLSNVVHAWC